MADDIETGTAPSSSEEGMKGFTSYRTEICLGGLSGLCVIICIICLCVAEDYFLYGVAVITIITAPLSVTNYKQYNTNKMMAAAAEGILEAGKEGEGLVNEFGDAIGELSETAKKIKELEESLDQISSTQGI